VSPLQRQLVAELRAAYHESGLTYLEIAGLAGMGENTVWRALNGARVNVPSLLRLCEVLKREVKLSANADQ
jgi:transcriptional regulator with XRE-family HTH domain